MEILKHEQERIEREAEKEVRMTEPIIVKDKRIQVPEEPKVPQAYDSNQVLMVAMNKGYDPAFIEKMLDLQERHRKNIAEQAYFEAVANFKAEAPPVKKDKHNKYFGSWYTSLGNLLDTYNPVLGKHGLSISFPPEQQKDGTLTVSCRLSHRMGHSESISLTSPIDQAAIGKASGQRSRNPIQDIKSTFTYLRSATCEAILGVAGTEGTVDDDGNGAAPGAEFITPEQAKQIQVLLKETGATVEGFLAAVKAETVDTIPAAGFGYAIGLLRGRKSAMKAKS